MKEDEMIALSQHHSSINDPRQLDFVEREKSQIALENGQYLIFNKNELPKPNQNGSQ